MSVWDDVKIVLEKQADGESCVGRDVLNSRVSTTADCTWHKHFTTCLCAHYISYYNLTLWKKTLWIWHLRSFLYQKQHFKDSSLFTEDNYRVSNLWLDRHMADCEKLLGSPAQSSKYILSLLHKNLRWCAWNKHSLRTLKCTRVNSPANLPLNVTDQQSTVQITDVI